MQTTPATREGAPAPARVKVRFAKGSGFSATLKERVDAYFAETGLSRAANGAMVVKTSFWLGLTALLYGAILSGLLPPLALLALALLLGFCLAAVGFNVGHDAIHGAWSEKPWLNRVLGWSFQIFGAASYTWSVAHNVVHHTYTNMPGHDEDLEPGFWLRFHDAQPRYRAYRFQHLYAWVLYGFTMLVWVFKKDFVQVLSKDPRTGKRPPFKAFLSVLASKALHGTLFIAIPLLVLDVPFWQFLLGYVAMLAVTGVTLAVVFQLAHVVEGPIMPGTPKNGAMATSWAEHQLFTTANFARGSFLAGFICGGLNHQVEHHLMPRVCHIHYPKLAPIVAKTAKEFGLPYHEHPTFLAAVRSHARVMKWLGRAPQRPPLIDLEEAPATA